MFFPKIPAGTPCRSGSRTCGICDRTHRYAMNRHVLPDFRRESRTAPPGTRIQVAVSRLQQSGRTRSTTDSGHACRPGDGIDGKWRPGARRYRIVAAGWRWVSPSALPILPRCVMWSGVCGRTRRARRGMEETEPVEVKSSFRSRNTANHQASPINDVGECRLIASVPFSRTTSTFDSRLRKMQLH